MLSERGDATRNQAEPPGDGGPLNEGRGRERDAQDHDRREPLIENRSVRRTDTSSRSARRACSDLTSMRLPGASLAAFGPHRRRDLTHPASRSTCNEPGSFKKFTDQKYFHASLKMSSILRTMAKKKRIGPPPMGADEIESI